MRPAGSPIVLALGGVLVTSGCASQATTAPPPQQAQLAQAIAAPDRAGPPEPLSPAAHGRS
jgi:hypothetical protein